MGLVTLDECGVCGGDNNTCLGCTNPVACNYDDAAIVDDGSCVLPDDCGVCGGDNARARAVRTQKRAIMMNLQLWMTALALHQTQLKVVPRVIIH